MSFMKKKEKIAKASFPQLPPSETVPDPGKDLGSQQCKQLVSKHSMEALPPGNYYLAVGLHRHLAPVGPYGLLETGLTGRRMPWVV